MEIARISIYPIKGTREVTVSEALVRPRGLEGDRRWMVVDPSGSFLQQRVEPRLALVQAALGDDGVLTVIAPGMASLRVVAHGDSSARRTVTVWGDSLSAADAGREAARWFSDYLQRDCHLVHMDALAHRPVASEYGQEGDIVSFADALPLLLASEASLDDLNRRIGRELPMSRFRPNVSIVGADAWDEDHWQRLRIGEVEFEITHPCVRCKVTTLDQQTGERDPDGEPLKTLATFRRTSEGVCFGQNLLPRSRGTIRVGDPIILL